jgi:hypothetical protein
MKDPRKWDIEIFAQGSWQLVAEGISYSEFLRRFGTGDYADYRLWSHTFNGVAP